MIFSHNIVISSILNVRHLSFWNVIFVIIYFGSLFTQRASGGVDCFLYILRIPDNFTMFIHGIEIISDTIDIN